MCIIKGKPLKGFRNEPNLCDSYDLLSYSWAGIGELCRQQCARVGRCIGKAVTVPVFQRARDWNSYWLRLWRIHWPLTWKKNIERFCPRSSCQSKWMNRSALLNLIEKWCANVPLMRVIIKWWKVGQVRMDDDDDDKPGWCPGPEDVHRKPDANLEALSRPSPILAW